ncbi:MAG: hypothetical protein WC548_04445 [Candidatus Pacearchaeota archaeon]
MKIIVIYGMSAVGKLIVANELSKITNFKISRRAFGPVSYTTK